MHLAPVIQDLAVVLALAAAAAYLFRRIRQPVVLGYLVAGIIAGPHTPPFSFVEDVPGVQVLAELGLVFLMFNLGLEFSFKKLLEVGKAAAVTGVAEALGMLALGYLTGRVAGYGKMDCIYLGGILSVSSTVIVLKTLEELKLKKERFARLIFGVLVVDDLVGILVVIALSTLGAGNAISGWSLALSFGKLALILGAWIVLGSLLVPRLVAHVNRVTENETMTLLTIALCLGLAAVSSAFHYSPALGAFVMGAILGESDEVERLERLMQPLRDVFAAVFFVSIGMLLDPVDLAAHWQLVLAVTIVTLVGKIVTAGAAARWMGTGKATALRVGFGLAQIGEFSFIIAALGLSLKVMSPFLYSVAVSVSVITTFLSPYLIRLSIPLGRMLES